jgi:hypothetical protein
VEGKLAMHAGVTLSMVQEPESIVFPYLQLPFDYVQASMSSGLRLSLLSSLDILSPLLSLG